jgi:hypothetical protein
MHSIIGNWHALALAAILRFHPVIFLVWLRYYGELMRHQLPSEALGIFKMVFSFRRTCAPRRQRFQPSPLQVGFRIRFYAIIGGNHSNTLFSGQTGRVSHFCCLMSSSNTHTRAAILIASTCCSRLIRTTVRSFAEFID